MIYILHIHFEINTRVSLRANTNDPMDPYIFMIFDDIKWIISIMIRYMMKYFVRLVLKLFRNSFK